MNVVPLLECLADGHYHSGQAIGERLGISRAAVWKQMQAIRDLGVVIEAVTGKGYCIQGGLELLDAALIESLLLSQVRAALGTPDVRFSTGSTNTDAMQKAQAGVERCLVLAEHQAAGRGRRGRQWVSPFGRNLYMSMLWTFQNGIAALEGLSLVCALAVKRSLQAIDSDISVKWPNDVYLDGKKLAGILLEVSGDVSGPCRVVMGIGLNAAMPAEHSAAIDQPFADLASGNNGKISRNSLAAGVINEWVKVLAQFESEGFEPFREEWMASDCYLGQRVEIRAGEHLTLGRHAGVDLSGRLLLDTDVGRITVAGGELMPSLRPAAS
ncbi:MAG TPA: bifunctional biotin--[acetyl-CoA-carboxylase] synthetase/biotin operon repressor [Pseudohongiella sp.]|nr:bifunctional biotin--[acetyl-CoA-carboxylase] synthetase/biotin operon repressor [Pseudohongiella sp.]HBX37807.1 bifunctional biotin--[acetyl-CoA-carboxylase] synthetase/biotin operon repressor [Pseudohongiella sp.]|tara:strand:+ start:1810 stop:2787 length:978 start_codon:yes stop_codon:yes gene_type:complete